MMVIPGDVAINGRASGSSWSLRAYPPWTKRPDAFGSRSLPWAWSFGREAAQAGNRPLLEWMGIPKLVLRFHAVAEARSRP